MNFQEINASYAVELEEGGVSYRYKAYVYWPGQGRGDSSYFYTFNEAWKWASYLLSPDMRYGRANNEVVIESPRYQRVESRPLCP